ncbi:MAG: ATP-binding protein [Actinomycetota bacterium]|nr:ATP-binding protein [Actinomycetota bacterium]MDK1017481.1 ATP-binding protein [Actinomycetota bacterium]MDK1027334.1 ATP-binding protein [Actinomycetota bacterium]MDK1037383.1 ATP-binding protein [Actinomycetota bacterium]MDK1097238.1 ATP-binding protein [Actinomycetota bacterium]
MTERNMIVDYRIRVIHAGLIVSWVALLLSLFWVMSLDIFRDAGAVLGGFTAGLVILTLAPWRSMLTSSVGDWAILMWSAAALMAVIIHEVTLGGQTNGVGFLLVLFFATATLLPDRALITLGVATIITFSGTVFAASNVTVTVLAELLLPFIAATIFVLLISVSVRTQLEATDAAYRAVTHEGAELARQERELTHLYEVSRTIGSGSKLDEVLPELIGRVAESVDARVGLVLLYDADTEHLELMSPIWVSGHTVRADEFSLGLDKPGVAQRVFMSGDSQIINDTSQSSERDRLVDELDAHRVAVVAMRIEDRTIGVLLVGDKDTDFTDDDLGTLESVAAPAALVLNQMARFEEARSMNDRMAELAQLKTDFVSVVSHELRTPLTSIIGAIGTLQRPELLPDDPRAQQLIEMAAKQANRLRTLIEDLLVMSRIEADSLPVRPERIDVAAFLIELIDALPNGESVTFDPVSDVGYVRSDPDHLTRVMTNLVENAMKYGGEGQIEIATSSHRNEVHISIIDHGPGIAYEQHDVIFERFTQLQPHATRSRGGAGLGLSIVKGLVEAMDGRVWYEPTPGGGATFTVAIPTGSATGPP